MILKAAGEVGEHDRQVFVRVSLFLAGYSSVRDLTDAVVDQASLDTISKALTDLTEHVRRTAPTFFFRAGMGDRVKD